MMATQNSSISFKDLLSPPDFKKRWFVTGGAGFIGSFVVDLLMAAGLNVTVYDNLSLSTDQWLKPYFGQDNFKFIKGDLLDAPLLEKSMAGHQIVWHLGANTDIPSGYTKHKIDLDNDVLATFNVLEAMLKNKIKEMLFASTGALYGESIKGLFSESSGPLLPLSLYGAGKLACEAFISAYSNLFGIKAWMFRFGNVIGGRMTHGIIFDFIKKLKQDPTQLEVLNDGKTMKNYFLVEDCIHGILSVYQKVKNPLTLLNLGTDSTSTVGSIAQIIIEEMNLKNVRINFVPRKRGWPGDQPVVLLDTAKVHKLGWYAHYASDEAVRMATRRMLGKDNFVMKYR